MEAAIPFFAAVIGGVLIVVYLVGAIWFTVAAFRNGALWGLGVLFVPFVPLIFLIKHWDDAKRSFLLSLAPVLVAVCAFMAMPGLLLLHQDTEQITPAADFASPSSPAPAPRSPTVFAPRRPAISGQANRGPLISRQANAPRVIPIEVIEDEPSDAERWMRTPSPECPPGTRLGGARPPHGLEQWCQRADGVRHGPYASWYGVGAEKAAGAYVEGREDGEWSRFHKNGIKMMTAHFRSGVQHGTMTHWTRYGQLKSETHWIDGRLTDPIDTQ